MVFIIGFTMGGLNYVVTVLQARARGMTLMRMPLTVWGIFTASFMALLAFPALFVGAVMMLLDRLLGTSFFMPAIVEMGQQLEYRGGSPILFQHLFWFFGHPEVYIVALPAFGIVSDLISTHARRNIFGYRMMVWAILAIGALSFVVWAHHMYVSGMDPKFGFFFATTTLIIAVPTAIKVYNWVLTLWRGDIHLTVPMLFALGFIVAFLNGGLTGLFLGNVVVDVPLSDTLFVVAHFHMVMGVAPILVIFGAIYHWYPKVTGRMLNERLGQLHFWVTFLGTYADLLPDALSRPHRHSAPLSRVGRDRLHPGLGAHAQRLHHGGGAVVGAAQLVFLFNLSGASSRARRPTAIPGAPPPWNGRRRDPAAARQLGPGPAGRLSLGLRLQRARRRGGFHPAEPAASAPERTHELASCVFLAGGRGSRLVAVAPATDVEALAGAERSAASRPPGWPAAARSASPSSSRWPPVSSRCSSAPSPCACRVAAGGPCRSGAPLAQHGVLVAASVALAMGAGVGRRDGARRHACGSAWSPAAAPGVVFLAGQVAGLASSLPTPAIGLAGNPANAFFYLLTGLHGLHIAGGLVGPRPDHRVASLESADPRRLRLSVDLCAIYWHFLLFVWLCVFALVAGWAAQFVEICRQLLT